MLSAFVKDTRDDWDDHLPYLLMAYRATPQESIGCSPNLLFLGREVTLPIDLMVPVPDGDELESNSFCYQEYVEFVKQAMQNAHAFARIRLRASGHLQYGRSTFMTDIPKCRNIPQAPGFGGSTHQ
jgi:hypothetical protein